MDITGPTKSPKASERVSETNQCVEDSIFCFFLVLPFVAFFQGNNNNKAVLFQSTSQFLPIIDEVHFLIFLLSKCKPLIHFLPNWPVAAHQILTASYVIKK